MGCKEFGSERTLSNKTYSRCATVVVAELSEGRGSH